MHGSDSSLPVGHGCDRVYLLMAVSPTACLLVHKREAREGREKEVQCPAAALLAHLGNGLLWRKLKFPITMIAFPASSLFLIMLALNPEERAPPKGCV